MVTLLLGPMGHGKSTEIVSRIKKDYADILNEVKESGEGHKHGIRSFLIVPEQQTLISERQLAAELDPTAQLYVEATNFTRLADSVFRKTGGLKYNYLTKGAQNLLMYNAICEVRDRLKHYKRIPKGREKSYVKLFSQAIGELKAYSISLEMLEAACDRLCTEGKNDEEAEKTKKASLLKAKLNDLMLVWSAYNKGLSDKYTDPRDTLQGLWERIGESGLFNGCNVYIDSFYGFTKGQLDVIARIMELANNVTIALDCPANATASSVQYVKIASTRDKILSLCRKLKKDYEIIPFNEDYKHKSEELRYICDNMWEFDAFPILPLGDVTLATASDEFDECEYVCTKIKEIINKEKDGENESEKYGEIAIIARNSATYRGIIEFCLDKYEIPYYFSAPSKLNAQPVVRMIMSALNALSGMRSEDVISYIKCGFTDIDEKAKSEFESYVYRWGIYGKRFTQEEYWGANPNGYKEMSKEQKEQLSRIRGARKLILDNLSALEKPFKEGATVSECTSALYSFLEAHNVPQKLLEEITKEPDATQTENAQTVAQVWDAIISALNTVVEICGNAVADPTTYSTLLSYAMMDTKIGTIPTGEDKVIIADASLVRAKNIRHVFVLGANEGVFPAVVDDNSFFSDTDKVALETVNINLTPVIINDKLEEKGFMSAQTFERSSDELFFFTNSIAAASHTACVISLKTDIGGSIRRPSSGFSRIKALLHEVKVFDTAVLHTVDKIYSREMANELYQIASENLKDAICDFLPERKAEKDAQEKENKGKDEAKIPAPVSCFANSDDKISTDLASEIFGDKIEVSKTSLETFASCHFDYYCSKILHLKDEEKIRFSHGDIGNYIHKVFEVFLKEKKAEKTYSRKEILNRVEKITDNYTAKVCGAHAFSNKMKHFFTRLKTTVTIFVEALLEERLASNLNPEFFEIDINGDGKHAPPPTELPINKTACAVLTGIADRIDVYRKDGRAYIRVADYKTGSHSFDLKKLDKGLDMQMLIYLLALCEMDDCEFKKALLGDESITEIVPQGIVYLTYNIDKTDASNELELFSADADDKEGTTLLKKTLRSGMEIDNDTVKSTNKAFNLKEGSLGSFSDFKQVFELVKAKIKDICMDMLSGNAEAKPLEGTTPCDYCKNGAICRRRVKSAHANR